jgi:phosphatidylglycerol:prolipoprotein diacylglycerol transferase
VSTAAQVTGSADVEPQALVVSSWFDSGEGDEPYGATLRFTGRRLAASGRPQQGDTFVRDETIDGVVPGTGPVSVTTWVYGVNPGDWNVDSELVRPLDRSGAASFRGGRQPGSRRANLARWSWRHWAVETAPTRSLRTRWALIAPLAPAPAVMPGMYTILAVLGGAIALLVQAAILSTEGVGVGPVLAVSLLAIVAGLIGAKAWYAVLHPTESIIRAGWAVDGFLVVMPVVGAIGLMVADLPIGRVLDATTPGLFFAVAIGRVGCFVTGCCAGQPTGSRWGIWSSDRRVGTRRIPVQLLESATGLLLGIATLPLAAGHVLPVHGAVFVVAFGLYAIARQAFLRLRSERRSRARSLTLTAGVAAAVLALVVVLSALQIADSPAFA